MEDEAIFIVDDDNSREDEQSSKMEAGDGMLLYNIAEPLARHAKEDLPGVAEGGEAAIPDMDVEAVADPVADIVESVASALSDAGEAVGGFLEVFSF